MLQAVKISDRIRIDLHALELERGRRVCPGELRSELGEDRHVSATKAVNGLLAVPDHDEAVRKQGIGPRK